MPYEDEQEEELSLLDIFNIVWRRRWLIFWLTALIGGAASLQLSLVLYNKIAATTGESYSNQKNHLNEILNKKL